jgi:uncharacterized protein YrrD
MAETNNLNVQKDLKEMTVLNSGTGEKLGTVHDAILHPTQGRLLGLVLRDGEGKNRLLSVRDFFIGRDAVMTIKEFRYETDGQSEALLEGIPAEQLKGSNVVTTDGRLLGRISDIYVAVEQPRTVYHVTESTLQRFFGGGFYLAGDVPSAYAPDGVRLIVPEETENRFAVSTVDEAFGVAKATA